jgi:hypothetical protein
MFGPLKKACEDTVTPMMRHCTTSCASGCAEGITTFYQVELVLFRGGRRLSTKMVTTLINNYAFRNIIVKFHKIFTFLTAKSMNQKVARIPF